MCGRDPWCNVTQGQLRPGQRHLPPEGGPQAAERTWARHGNKDLQRHDSRSRTGKQPMPDSSAAGGHQEGPRRRPAPPRHRRCAVTWPGGSEGVHTHVAPAVALKTTPAGGRGRAARTLVSTTTWGACCPVGGPGADGGGDSRRRFCGHTRVRAAARTQRPGQQQTGRGDSQQTGTQLPSRVCGRRQPWSPPPVLSVPAPSPL